MWFADGVWLVVLNCILFCMCFVELLPLEEAIASRAVLVIVSRSDGRVAGGRTPDRRKRF